MPVISLAIEPLNRDDQERLVPALARVAEEDPSLHIHIDEDTGQTLLSGMGELHLEVIIHRLEREFHAHVRAGRPQVVYRETISGSARETGGLRPGVGRQDPLRPGGAELLPRPRGAGNMFTPLLPEDHPAQAFMPVVAQAVQEALEGGPVYGHPAVDVAVALHDAAVKEGQSTEMAFRIATMTAVKQGLHAGPAPTPGAHHAGGDHRARRIHRRGDGGPHARKGKVEQLLAKGPVRLIAGLAPLAEMFGYATALRSLTQGRGTFTLQFHHFGWVDGGGDSNVECALHTGIQGGPWPP